MEQSRWPEGLDAERDAAHQHATWRFERMGWAAMLLVLIAAFAGLWGDGPLGRGQAGAPETASLEYDRLVRHQAPTALRFRVAEAGDAVTLWIDRAYIDAFEIQRIVPEPESIEVTSDRLIYRFAARPGAAMVTFQVEASHFGPLAGAFGLEGGPAYRFDTFIYP